MEIYKIRFLWNHILFLTFHCITTTNTFVTMPCMYMKHSQNVNETCAEISFVKTKCNVLNCANMCALSTGCFSFYYSDITKRCIGCLMQYTLLHSTDSYTYYIPVKGKNGNMCGYFQYNSHYYSFNTDLLTVEEAESKCSSSGGHLVYVETALEHSFLENISALIPGITSKYIII
ncbi:uncharacterized protein LOC132728139 [Ruditapes philippinarum]|uniref:uncharacterized protein LOC132728139 n=1 Tax=Ruditapes philippinarum TaxID=129788 RepID=UPI00295A7448|nr:uncharacterized protein LOC132728139 [Ruditapes philippinarum]